MAETQHLCLPETMPIKDSTPTPLRRGHRHKRSFAISGDFEFLKQANEASMAPGAFSGRRTSNPDIPRAQDANACNILLFSEPPRQVDTSPFATQVDFKTPPPNMTRFFASEEPKFSSPFHGVPDAIINLDDALKTKPKSFKSHRRSESAPAELELLQSPKFVANTSSIQEYVEEEEEEEEDGAYKRSPQHELMSPIRPSTNPQFNHESGDLRQMSSKTSMVRSSTSSSANGNGNLRYNSLKINKQKQRYFHQLAMRAPPLPQPLRGQHSSGSLLSISTNTPSSTANTPHSMSTPSTPLASAGSAYKHLIIQPHYNDALQMQKSLSMNDKENAKNTRKDTIFQYKTKIYDMPYGVASASSNLDDALANNDNGNDSSNYKNSSSGDDNLRQDDVYMDQLLLGEPGDSVDFSSMPSSSKNFLQKFDTFTISGLTIDHDTQTMNSNNTASNRIKDEPRSVSDSIVEKRQSTSPKKRSKFRNFVNLFK